jgi:hypothetical protein
MKIIDYGSMLYNYFKKGFMFGVDYELAHLIPYKTITREDIMVIERAQIILLKVFSTVV